MSSIRYSFERTNRIIPNLNTKIILIVRNEKTIIPSKMQELKEGDDIYLLSDSNNIKRY